MKNKNSFLLIGCFLSIILLSSCNIFIPETPPPNYIDYDNFVVDNLNVTGRLHNEYPHAHGISTILNPVTEINKWYNITWNQSASYIMGNISFYDNNIFLINEEGDYGFVYGVSVIDGAPSPDANVAFRIYLNGQEVKESYFETTTSKQNAVQWLEHFTYIDDLEIGDKVSLQYISSDKTVMVNSLGTFSDRNKFTAYIFIERTLE